MKKSKKTTFFLSVLLCATIFFSGNVYASNETQKGEDGYNSTLEQIGITHDVYNDMPQEKKDLWRDFYIEDVRTETKYYKTTEYKNSVKSIKPISNSSNQMNVISEYEYLKNTNPINRVKRAAPVSTDVTTGFVKMTTKLFKGIGSEWGVSNDVTIVYDNPFGSSNQVIGIGNSSQFSILKGSEILTTKWLDRTVGLNKSKQYFTAKTRQATGYAFAFPLYSHQIKHTASMAVRMVKNNKDATLIDAYGQYAQTSISISPSVSFDVKGGVSFSVSPSSQTKYADNTHVQAKL